MKLIEILKQRATSKKYDSRLCLWLIEKISEIIDDTTAHLRYVQNVLTEFDIHDDNHSECVLCVIEDLLGTYAKQLSSYDLFSLIAVSYLHDCGMAVSDYEINVMKLIENDVFDGKKVCSVEQALSIIEQNKDKIFRTSNDLSDVKGWLFYPGSENALFEYYSQLLIDYQAFRNGKIDVIKKNKAKEMEKKNLDLKTDYNKDLRIDYLRLTHADRVESYIKTWGKTKFANFLGNQAMGQKLANNLAIACKAHGKDAEFVDGLRKLSSVMYIGGETSNIQFIAMMLRIGDIVHFSYDRAPIVLRALHQFESDYSRSHWVIKSECGVTYAISKNKEIVYSAFCKKPKDYFNLMSYVNYIDQELLLYNRLKQEASWSTCYPLLSKNKVNRDNIVHDGSFLPVPNLCFTLEQNRILELLMGTHLYSDEYACLRELYQNSLDACRCQIAIDKTNGKTSEGKIEFGIGADEEENKYLYCLDNGKGMSKDIIERYLLKIGSSYYKSSDFFQHQAATGNSFTPSSQFGIGLLSCFMIGDVIEITTREEGGNYLSCVMEYDHQRFYYKTPTYNDSSKIASSGTLTKVFLKKKYKERLSNKHIKRIGYLLWRNSNSGDAKIDISGNLYCILNSFVQLVPNNIVLNVRMDDGNLLRILDKPLRMGEGEFRFPEEDTLHLELLDNSNCIELDVEHDGMRYRTILPLLVDDKIDYSYYQNALLWGGMHQCVDGIVVKDCSLVKGLFANLTHLSPFCSISFNGSDRPQLNVSRDVIVEYDANIFEEKFKALYSAVIKQAIDKIVCYISEHKINQDSSHYRGIWDSFFRTFERIHPSLIIQCLKEGSEVDLIIPLPPSFTSSKMTFGQFLGENLSLEDYCFFCLSDYSDVILGCCRLLHSLICYRLLYSREVALNGADVLLEGYIPKSLFLYSTFPVNDGVFHEYDLAFSLYPFISTRLHQHLSKDDYGYFDHTNYLYNILERVVVHEVDHNFRRVQTEQNVASLASIINEESDIINELSLEGSWGRYYDQKLAITMFVPSTMIATVLQGPACYPDVINNSHFYREGPIQEGLSLIMFGLKYLYAIPGRWSCQELVELIPNDFMIQLGDIYHFADGHNLIKSKSDVD